MYRLALAMNGGNPKGALALIRTGAFQAAWQKRSLEIMAAVYEAYLADLLTTQGSSNDARDL